MTQSQTDEKHDEVPEMKIEHAEMLMNAHFLYQRPSVIQFKCAISETNVKSSSIIIFECTASHGLSAGVFNNCGWNASLISQTITELTFYENV